MKLHECVESRFADVQMNFETEKKYVLMPNQNIICIFVQISSFIFIYKYSANPVKKKKKTSHHAMDEEYRAETWCGLGLGAPVLLLR